MIHQKLLRRIDTLNNTKPTNIQLQGYKIYLDYNNLIGLKNTIDTLDGLALAGMDEKSIQEFKDIKNETNAVISESESAINKLSIYDTIYEECKILLRLIDSSISRGKINKEIIKDKVIAIKNVLKDINKIIHFKFLSDKKSTYDKGTATDSDYNKVKMKLANSTTNYNINREEYPLFVFDNPKFSNDIINYTLYASKFNRDYELLTVLSILNGSYNGKSITKRKIISNIKNYR